MFIVYFVGTAV